MSHLEREDATKFLKALKTFFFSLVSASFVSPLPTPAKAEQIIYKLLNGDSISGELLKEESRDDLKVIMHEYLGRIEIRSTSIAHPKAKAWSGNLEVGLDGSSTTSSSSLGYLLELNTKYKDNTKELNLGTRYDLKKSSKAGEEEITAIKKALAKVRYDHSITNKWTTYLSSDYEYNALNKIGVNDINSSAGIAYKIIKNPQATLRVSAGPSLGWIDGGSDCSKESNCGDIQPGASFGTDFIWSVNQKIELLFDNIYNTQLANNSNASNKFLTAIRFFPSSQSDLYASLSYENIYDQIKEPSQEHVYQLKLGTKF